MEINHTIELTNKQKVLFENMRGTWFDIVSYLPENELIELCDCLSPLAYGLCCHDKDINADTGELKKIHTHLVLCFNTRRRATRLVKLFNTTQVRVIETDYQLKGSFDYLIHENEVDKVKYEKSKRYVFNQEYFDNFQYTESCKDNTLDIINKIIAQVPLRELVRDYGRDFCIHYKSYNDLAMAIYSQERTKYTLSIMDDCEEDIFDKAIKDSEKNNIIQDNFLGD